MHLSQVVAAEFARRAKREEWNRAEELVSAMELLGVAHGIMRTVNEDGALTEEHIAETVERYLRDVWPALHADMGQGNLKPQGSPCTPTP